MDLWKREAALAAWEATNALREDVDEEEFSFTPQIKAVKGISSTMGDYMQGWSEKRQLHVFESRCERQLVESEKLPFQPELLAKSANETLLKGAGYAGPIQAWRQHAEKYKQVREPDNEKHPEVQKADEQGKKLGRGQRSWGPVVQRLYPVPAKASNDILCSTAGDDAGAFSQEVGGDASAGTGVATPGSADCAADTDMSSVTPGLPGRRRYGRPPKATWQYLYESGTRKERSKSTPAQVKQHVTPSPLERSEQMLQNERCTRRPVWSSQPLEGSGRSKTPTPPRSVTPPPSAPHPASQARPRSASSVGTSSGSASGRRLFEQSERHRARHEQRKMLATELKIAEEMRECTFRPQTNSACRGVAVPSSSSRASEASMDEGLSLYERGILARARRKQRNEEGALDRAEAELSQCTFRPIIHRVAKSAPSQASQSVVLSASESPSEKDLAIADESFRPSELSPTSQQPQDLTTTVLSMLDDWKGQGVQFSPPSRVPPDQQFWQQQLQQEPDDVYISKRDDDMLDRHSQRPSAVSGDVQALLQNWRGGWGSGGQSVSSSLAATRQSGGLGAAPLAASPLSPSWPSPGGPETSASPALIPMLPPQAGEEANVFAMLERWRMGQHM